VSLVDRVVLVLGGLGAQCIRALDGRTALQAARHSRPTMALLDAKLPDIDGLELARNLRMADPGILVLVSTNATRQLKQPKSWGPAARFSTSTPGG
jgi:DNA-binding response OmpR family regulator